MRERGHGFRGVVAGGSGGHSRQGLSCGNSFRIAVEHGNAAA
jgi:hypothetical protein